MVLCQMKQSFYFCLEDKFSKELCELDDIFDFGFYPFFLSNDF